MYKSVKLNPKDIRSKIERGEIKIVYKNSSGISRMEILKQWIPKVLEAIGEPEALVTDETKIIDFYIDKTDEISEKIGIKVSCMDRIVDIANRLRVRHYCSN